MKRFGIRNSQRSPCKHSRSYNRSASLHCIRIEIAPRFSCLTCFRGWWKFHRGTSAVFILSRTGTLDYFSTTNVVVLLSYLSRCLSI